MKMVNHVHSCTTPFNHERGATLVVALIVLLLMSVIGLSAYRGSWLNERMVSNQSDLERAFEGSEAALRDSEWVLTNNSATLLTYTTGCATGCGPNANVKTALLSSMANTDTPANCVTADESTAADINNSATAATTAICPATSPLTTIAPDGTTLTDASTYLHQSPRYIIENAGTIVEPCTAPCNPSEPRSEKKVRRVTAASSGGSGGAIVLLESTYLLQ